MSEFRNVCALFAFAALMAATGCTNASTIDAPILDSEALREGCIGDSLATLLAAADRLAPYAYARHRATIERLGARFGASFELDAFDGDPFRIRDDHLRVRGDDRETKTDLEFVRDGVVVSDLADARGVRVRMNVEGAAGITRLDLELAPDGEGGIAVSGTVLTEGFGDCVTRAELDGVSIEMLADTGDGRPGARFAKGQVAFDVRDRSDRPLADAEVALSGHKALVWMRHAGASELSELSLVPGAN